MAQSTSNGNQQISGWCNICKIPVNSRHFVSENHFQALYQSKVRVVQVETSIKNRVKTYFIKNFNEKQLNLSQYVKSLFKTFKQKLEEEILSLKAVKANIYVHTEFVLPTLPPLDDSSDTETKVTDESETQIVIFKTIVRPFFSDTNIEEKLEIFHKGIMQEYEDLKIKGSGWILKRIIGSELRINLYAPLDKAGSFIPLPFTSKHIVNVQNTEDKKCFLYAMLGKHLPKDHEHKSRPSVYSSLIDKYDFSQLEFPVPLHDICKFEKLNDVSISVFGINAREEREDKVGEGSKKKRRKRDDFKIFPLKVAREELADHTDILFIGDGSGNFHYAWISNFEALVASQLTNRGKHLFICKKCFQHYDDPERLASHKVLCEKVSKDCFIPKCPVDTYVEFKNHEKAIRHNYVAYCDFESQLSPIQKEANASSFPYQKHLPIAYSLLLVSGDPNFHMLQNKPLLHFGEDSHIHFVNRIIKIGYSISEHLNDQSSPITMTPEEEAYVQAVEKCEHCNLTFTNENPKMRDHDHQRYDLNEPNVKKTNFRAVLCRKCNFKFYHTKSFVVVFHNGSKYDFKFIILGLNGNEHEISILPSTDETYISFIIRLKNGFQIVFVDSYRFLSFSLSQMVSTLKDESFILTRNICKTDEQLEITKQKAVFPYDYLSDMEKLSITHPPPREDFYNKLQDEHISEADYERFCHAWRAFKVGNLHQYLKLYLAIDTVLLADCVEAFRKFCLDNFQLDPMNYVTLPSFAYDAFLKMSGQKIKLFDSYDHHLFIDSGIRGGLTQASLKFAKANNPYLPDSYDPSQPTSYISYIDANGLYNYIMASVCLPYDDYEWLSESELLELKDTLMSKPDDGPIGYILDCDLIYPEHLHEEHVWLPFLPQKKIPPLTSSKHPKLLADLSDKRGYVCHYVILKQALENGLILEKINRGMKFSQKPYMKTFMEKCGQLRKEAKNDEFKSQTIKLIANANFGVNLMNPLKFKKVKLVTNEKQLNKQLSKVEFEDRTIFDDNLVAIHLKRTEVLINRPNIVGFSILEHSKRYMYHFFYQVLMKKYGVNNIKLIYHDTDSYALLIYTEDIYRDMIENKFWFDTSNYPPDHPTFSLENCKILGKFKDECPPNMIIAEWVCLMSKLYAFIAKSLDGKAEKTHMRAKGVQKSVVKKTFNFDLYKEVLFDRKEVDCVTRRIQSKKLQLYSFEIKKIALSFWDDKRFPKSIIETLPWFHKDIQNLEMLEEPPKRKKKKTQHPGDLNA